ncbi:MAG: sigma-70 family RNA polymerase sigma factor [Blastocatellia bacterium]|nr:sigma-70 family RNA polymerase sigma factor [Blastocatellia bacterium]
MALKATQFKVIEGAGGAAADRSPQDLESLFRDHGDRVFRVAYRITGSIVDAEDVLQTVFLRLSRRQGDWNLEPNPGSYLHRASINASLDLMRQRGRAQAVSIDEVAPTLAAHARLSPESQAASGELRGALRGAIAKLGEKSAEMFVLKYFEGYDNTEIAEMTGTSAMVVGVLLHRARTRVKKEVGEFVEGGRS